LVTGTTPPGSASILVAREPSLSQTQRLASIIALLAPSSPSPSCRDAADRLAGAVLDDAAAQRLQLAVELTRDQPLPQQL
jgi:hypothetical protein